MLGQRGRGSLVGDARIGPLVLGASASLVDACGETATFQDLNSRGWEWEQSQVRRLDRVDRMLFVLFLVVCWLAH